MYTNRARVTGLSGIDTESMIKKLMDAESMRLTTLEKSRQKLVWQQDSYRNVSTALKNFQNSMLSLTTNKSNSIRLASNFKGLVSTVKQGGDVSGSVTVSAGADAVAGDYKLIVNKVAKADAYRSQAAIGGSIALDELDLSNLKAGDSFKISLDGAAAKEITLDTADLASKEALAGAINDKLSVFGNDPTGQKVMASINPDTGKVNLTTQPGHKITITDGKREGTSSTGAAIDYGTFGDTLSGNFKVSVNGVDSDVSFSFDISGFKDDQGVYDTAKINIVLQQALNGSLKAAGVDGSVSASVSSDGKITFSNNSNNKITVKAGSDSSFSKLGFGSDIELRTKSTVAAMGTTSGKTNSLDLNSPAFKVFGSGAFNGGSATFTINGHDLTISENDSISAVLKTINESSAGVKAAFDTASGKFTIENKASGANNALSFSDKTGTFLNDIMKLNMSTSERTGIARDAEFTLNNVTTTRESNNFSVNGLNIALTEASEGKTFDINLKNNSEGTLNLVKNFVKEYNALVDAINAEYKVQRPKSDKYSYYEPLSDAEKDSMKEKQIEEWESKAKIGFNYNDSIIGGIAGQMRTMLYTPVTLRDGTNLSLYEIGITTSSALSETGKITLDEDKFNKYFSEHPDDIGELFTKSATIPSSDKTRRNQRLNEEGIADRLNDIVNWAISSGGSLYKKAGIENTASGIDNDMYKQIKAQEDKISDMRKTLANKETYYYNMFSKLETAITASNSQMASLQSLLGL